MANRQTTTGTETESLVAKTLRRLGLAVHHPRPDRGVDMLVTSPSRPGRPLRLQVKGRGPIQRNRRFRWFQIRATQRQRQETIAQGLPPCQAWRQKAALVDMFVLVALKHRECWIFTPAEIERIIAANRLTYGARTDNQNGHQAEMDLDVPEHGKHGHPLTEVFRNNRNNWQPILAWFTCTPTNPH